MTKRKKTPSKIPVSGAWVRKEHERRLSRRSGGQSGGADQRGTDHSSPISLPSLSQPSSLQTAPAPPSQEFGRIGDFTYSNEGTPIGSEISLVSDGSSVTTPVITENPFSIFSPRPAREFDKTQSAPSSPGRSALSPRLLRADTDPCVGSSPAPVQRSPFLGVPQVQSLSWDHLSLPGVNSVHKIPIISTPDSPLTPCTAVPVAETNFVFPSPLLSFYSPHRRVESNDHLDLDGEEAGEETVESNMAEAVKEAMRKEDFALRRLSKQIRLGIRELPAIDLRDRGPGGVLEELESIKRDRVTFIELVEDYEENYHQVEVDVIPVIGDVTHDVQFWTEEGEKLVDEVGTHRKNILNELQLMKKEESQAVSVAEDAEKRDKRKKEIEKAKRLGYETDGLQRRVSLLLPTITDWSAASRQELLEAFKRLRDVTAEHDKMRDSFNDCEEVAVGKTEEEMAPVNMTILRRNIQI